MSTEPESPASSMSEKTQSPTSVSPPVKPPAREPQQSFVNSSASDTSVRTTAATTLTTITPARQPTQIVFRTYVPPPTSISPATPDPPDTSQLVRDLRHPDGSRRELTPYYRGILVGLRLGGLTLDKISRMTGISKGTIHACVKRDAERPGYQGEPLKKKGRPRKVVEDQDGEEGVEGQKKRRKVQTVKPPGATSIIAGTSGQPPAQKTGTTPKAGTTQKMSLGPGALTRVGAGRRGGVRKVVPGELNLVFEHPETRMWERPIEERLLTELSRENGKNRDTPMPEAGTS